MQVDTASSEFIADDINVEDLKEIHQEGSIVRDSTINSNSETLQSSNNGTLHSKESFVESTATTKEAVQIPLIYMHSHHPTKPLENLCKDPNCPMNKPQSESGVGSSYISDFSPEQQQELSYQYLKQYYEQYNQQNEQQPKIDKDTLNKLEDYLNIQSKLRERDQSIKGPDAYNVEILNDDEEVDVQSSISQQDLLKRRLARNKFLEQFGQKAENVEQVQDNGKPPSEFIQPQVPQNGFGFPNNVPFGYYPGHYGPGLDYRSPVPFGPGAEFRGPMHFDPRVDFRGHAPFGPGFPFQRPGFGSQSFDGFENWDRSRRSRASRATRGPRGAREDSHRHPEYPPRFQPNDPPFYPTGFGRPAFQHSPNGFPSHLHPPQPPQPPQPPNLPPPPPAPPISHIPQQLVVPLPPTPNFEDHQRFNEDGKNEPYPNQETNTSTKHHKIHRFERRARRDLNKMLQKSRAAGDSDSSSFSSSSTNSHSKGNNSDIAEPSEFADGGSIRSFEDEEFDQSHYPSDSSHTYHNSQAYSYGGYPYPYPYPAIDNGQQMDAKVGNHLQNLNQHHGTLNTEVAFKNSELAALEAEIQTEIIRKQIELGNMPNKTLEERAKFKDKAMDLVNLQVSLEKRRAKAKAEIAKVQAEIMKVQADQARAQAEMTRKRLDDESQSVASVREIKEEAKTYDKLEKGFLKEASKLDSKAKSYDDKIEGFDAKMQKFDERMKRFDSRVQDKIKKAQKENEPKKEKEGFFTRWTNYFKGEVQKEVSKAAIEVQKNLSEAAEDVHRELTNAAKEVRSELGIITQENSTTPVENTNLKSQKSDRSLQSKNSEVKDSPREEFPKEVAEELENAFAELLTKDPDTEVEIVNSKIHTKKPLPEIPNDQPQIKHLETNYKVKVLGSDMKVKKVTGPGKFVLSVTVSDDEDNN
ncbi:hypothetical protein HDV06_006544 [Boothiomyces sp. JEL0866]|nr:hypothetical protein HDV06_006544 [Boothiomyces sp. JEL0866]